MSGPRRLVGGRHPGLRPVPFVALSVLLGVVAAVGAYVFRTLIALVHNLAFYGELSTTYDATIHSPPSPWGPAVAFVPVIGAVGVVFLVQRFAPEAKGHGVPEVMDAIYYQKSVIRPIVAVVKSLGSALSIGTGGSVGREGPIVQIGAAFGSTSGGVLGASNWQRATLVAAGGGAGIAATFNTPIGGLLFAVEILLHEVSVRTLVPIGLATATATYLGRALFGNAPAFPVPVISYQDRPFVLAGCALLGALTALAAVLFIRGLYGTEDLLARLLPGRPYLEHMIGMFAVGLIIAGVFWWRDQYYVQGVGYATIVDLLSSRPAIWFVLVLFGLKLLATVLTLGSGASGGVFSPSLFMGAALGSAFASLLPGGIGSDATVFVLAGMAGMVAGTTGAVLTATVMLFEMTLDYPVVLPMLLAASVSYGVRRSILADSIYTMKLTRRGHVMPGALQANAHLVHHVADISPEAATVVDAGAAPPTLDLPAGSDAPEHLVVVDGDRVVGLVARDWLRCHPAEVTGAATIADLVRPDHVVVDPTSTVFDLLVLVQKTHADAAVVVQPGTAPSGATPHVVGVITKAHIAEAIAEGMELFED